MRTSFSTRAAFPLRSAVRRRAAVLVASALVVAGCGGTTDSNGGRATVTATAGSCAWRGAAPRPGGQDFTVANKGKQQEQLTLIDASSGLIWAKVTTLAVGTTRSVHAVLPAGRYAWRCVPQFGVAHLSTARATAGKGDGEAPGQPLRAMTAEEANNAVATYRNTVSALLQPLAADTDALAAAVGAGDLDGARSRWLAAHLDYERLGAAYGTFGDLADRIDGLPAGHPRGVDDSGFTGFLKVEHDLWNGVSGAPLAGDVQDLDAAVRQLVADFPNDATNAADLPLRAHEILEMSEQRELTGRSDEGSHSGLATARANLDGTTMVFDVLADSLRARQPQLEARIRTDLAAATAELDGLRRADGSWPAPDGLPTADREKLDARLGALLEDLAPVPDVLTMPPSLNVD